MEKTCFELFYFTLNTLLLRGSPINNRRMVTFILIALLKEGIVFIEVFFEQR